MLVFFWVSIAAFGISYALTRVLARPGGPLQILDLPNERSLHVTPVPRTGGLAIWVGTIVGTTIAVASFGPRPEFTWIAAATVTVGLVSFIDDRFGVPVWFRLAVHLVAAALLVVGGLGLRIMLLPGVRFDLGSTMGLMLTVLFVVWMTNLYNFMDGMDGFAAGMAVFGFGVLGVLGYLAGDPYFAALCWGIAAAAGGFLVWNFPQASIFMGDIGSSTLGMVAAGVSLWADRAGLFPLWVAALVFSPFIVDATVTLLRRVARKQPVWKAHRSHYYQRLVQLGWGHKKTVLVEYLLMTGCGLTAIALQRAPTTVQWLGLCAWGVVYLVGSCAVARLETGAR